MSSRSKRWTTCMLEIQLADIIPNIIQNLQKALMYKTNMHLFTPISKYQ